MGSLPDPFEEWLEAGRGFIRRARGDHELDQIEATSTLLSVEARVERIRRTRRTPAPEPPPPAILGNLAEALSAAECARATGWRAGQTPRRGWSPRWFYDHADDLPFAIRKGGTVRFLRTGFLRWLATRAAS